MNFIYIKNSVKISTDSLDLLFKIFGEFKQTSPTGNDMFIYSIRGSDKTLYSNNLYLSFIQGYVRDPFLNKEDKLEQHKFSYISFLYSNLLNIQQRFSGIFSVFSINKLTGDIILSADWTALYPIYYYIEGENIVVSSSINAIAALLPFEIDMIAVLQRAASGKPFNYGRRTMIKNVRRILWREKIIIKKGGNISISREKGLYRIKEENLKTEATNLFATIKSEFELALRFDNLVNVAQSGGIDSRLTLGAIPDGKTLRCLTYGSEEYYESFIAKSCATKQGATHKVFPVFDDHFPSRQTMLAYLIAVGPFEHNVWFSILEHTNFTDELLLFGDMCEAITGRKISNLKKRDKQFRTAIRQYILNKPIKFTVSSDRSIADWERMIIDNVRKEQSRINSNISLVST